MPAVATSPNSGRPSYSDGSATDLSRRYSDDYTRKHLADVQEADEDTETGALFMAGDFRDIRFPSRERKPSTCSTYSVTSMDALWEHHPRRLSEAGLRRTSDHSVVLTEDTDSFIIGDRVWVGGSKPGQIAYIGDTQFAPGEWAGVVLDEPIGKNDGSVAGIRYFQCESRKGVFSRLTRLTHEPLTPPSPASPASEFGSATNGGSRPSSALRTPTSPAPRTPVSPAPRTPARVTPTRTTKRSTSPNGSMRSFSSRMSTSTIPAELRLGDRVIVSSSQGSKAGILRYMGPTDFAQGQWCGVELDDPIGKNDGSVEGKRYFECGPRFGLFAPLSKVSRSPSNRKPGSCAVHGSRVNSPPESMTSMTSSLIGSVARPRLGVTSLAGGAQRLSGPRASSTPMSAKNTLQELLREKQQHIEKLIKEHEVERGELAKISLQMDRTQSALVTSQKENAQYAKEIEKLKAEYEALSRQLEDEKQKVEDLMFRTEEDNIHKEDFARFKDELLKDKEKLTANVQGLETELEQMKRQVDELQAQCVLSEGQHKAEEEILMAQHKDEVQAAHVLAAELQKLLDEAHALLREKNYDKESLDKSHIEEVAKIKSESDKCINELKSKLSETEVESSEQIKLLIQKLTEAGNKITTQNDRIEKITLENSSLAMDLRSQLEQKQVALDLKIQEHNQVLASFKESELVTKKEIDKLRMELSSKLLDCESLGEENKKLDELLKKIQAEFETLNSNLTSRETELQALSSSASKQTETIQSEINQLKESLSGKQAEVDNTKAELQEKKLNFQKQIEEHVTSIGQQKEEISNLTSQIENIKRESTTQIATLQTELNKKLEDKDSQLSSITKQLEEQTKIFEEITKTNDVLNTEKIDNENEIKKLTESVSEKQSKLDELFTNISDLTSKFSTLELQNGDLTRQLRSEMEKTTELQQRKDKLESEISNLSSHSTSSGEQINILSNKLKEAEKDLESVKESNREKVNALERTEQELKQKLEQIQMQSDKDKNETIRLTQEIDESKKKYEEQINVLNTKITELQQNSASSLSDLETRHQDIISDLMKQIELKTDNENQLKQTYEQLNTDTNAIINDLNHRLEVLQESGQTSECQLKEKLNELITTQNELNQKLEASQESEKHLQESHLKIQEEYNRVKEGLENQLKESNEKLQKMDVEIQRIQNESDGTKNNNLEKDNLIKDLQRKISIYEVELKSNVDIVSEKERQVNNLNGDIKKMLEDKHELEKNLNTNIAECANIQQKLSNITEDNGNKETQIKEHENTIAKLKEYIEGIISDKKNLEGETVQTTENLSKLQSANDSLNDQISKLQNSVTEMNSDIKIRNEKITALESELNNSKDLQSTIEKLKTDLKSQLNEIENKNVTINKLNDSLNLLKKDTISETTDKEQKLRSLENEIAEIKTLHLHESSELKKTIHHLENEKNETEKKLVQLEEANVKIAELKSHIENSEADIQKLTTLNNAQKTNYEQLNSQLQEDYEKLKIESKKDRKQIKEQLKTYESQVCEKNKQLESEQTQQRDLQLKYDEVNDSVKELQNKLKYLEASSEKKAGEEKSELQKVVLELQSCQKAHDEEAKLLKSEISLLNEQIVKKNNDSSKYSNHISTLENNIKKHKTENDCLINEITILNSQLKESKNLTQSDLNSNTNLQKNLPVEPDTKRLLEEKEEVEGQVSFLNSVIVDMQRKNEELKARVEVLEMGCTPQEADEFNFNGLKPKTVAPRMYCDICDVFDAHETEDCPRQTSDPDAPAPASDKKKPPAAPRPYCDICEMFGHATEDCDDEETF